LEHDQQNGLKRWWLSGLDFSRFDADSDFESAKEVRKSPPLLIWHGAAHKKSSVLARSELVMQPNIL